MDELRLYLALEVDDQDKEHCTNPKPMYGGIGCSGDAHQEEKCATYPCPIIDRFCLNQVHISSKTLSIHYSLIEILMKLL
ncbi:hypothetical protein KUTeg_001862 [Tegillarca granosa]|uniref:Uncharacterized protein n=1 Tax=Tegillarca granosa TaxID=220873 RepID=A0ABQ9FVE8_TEGGR|nr:hypothetical protein KUTeg_001862 [Tegillarca granosa]